MEEKEKQERKYLTEAHKRNEQAAAKQIAEWQSNPAPLEKILERQRKRDQQAKNMK